ncbi:6-hydroxymethylpterin diphosphokinase MptE-like protein [Pseudoalteromonas sp. SR43-5]|uniref:motility associated factor glycosyltransferase family protein n=1 Tax=Pseudoalteromonas sp. SR43-5 TaxID=2760941 RepID=UPI00287345E4|nr:6-hydroxymethylpterin diphosphokinase MptE-like protein [Pseudoalteromonas sp. SR43-5]
MDTTNLELQKMILKATLISNLELLKEKMPNVYNTFKNFEVENLGVALDEFGQVNLINNNEFTYREPPSELAVKQVELFLQEPAYHHYGIAHESDEHNHFKHSTVLKKIYNNRVEAVGSELPKPTNEERLDFICFFGAGLGYQIEELIRKKKLLNVFLFEPNNAVFYAMLHCVELRPLFEHCTNQGGTFSLCIGGNEYNAVNEISTLLNKQGHFNLSLMYFFKHYDSPLMDKVAEKIKEVAHRWHSGWGFFEDEIIGISHTISNLKLQFPVLKKANTFKNCIKEAPVFIVANGPSLDLAIDFLKANKEDIIIISCGTALKALLVNDIKPDMHIEMERVAILDEFVRVVERTDEVNIKLNDLNIIALNTVYHGILSRFKAAFLLNKVNDAGGCLIKGLDKESKYSRPFYTNPTVTNAAVAVAVELGFELLYFIGMDFGFVSEKYHHSKHSIFFDKDFKHKERFDGLMKNERYVKGNFRDRVGTTNTFDSSKSNVELLLQEQTHVKAFNTSDGAFIQNTEAKDITDVKISKKLIDKNSKVKELLCNASSSKGLAVSDVLLQINDVQLKTKHTLEQLLSFTSIYFDTRENLSSAFLAQNKMLLEIQNKDEMTFWLVQGSFKYFQAYIMSNIYYYSNQGKRTEFMNTSIDIFHQHIVDIYLELIESYDKPAKY